MQSNLFLGSAVKHKVSPIPLVTKLKTGLSLPSTAEPAQTFYMATKITCDACGGRRTCSRCEGTGKGIWYGDCSACDGNKKCPRCMGKGWYYG